jgi:hypothetical protein
MSIVAALGQPASAALRARGKAGPSGFRVLDDADGPASAAVSAPAPVGLHGLLALQEAEADAVQDRAAWRHAGAMLDDLSSMQRALLGSDPDATSAALGRLADAARRGPAAADPRLGAVMRAIATRAAIEAARHASREAAG